MLKYMVKWGIVDIIYIVLTIPYFVMDSHVPEKGLEIQIDFESQQF